jgi:hypothetical protein
VGFGLLAWGVIGLQLSDLAEEKLGFKPSEEDKATLSQVSKSFIVGDKGKNS